MLVALPAFALGASSVGCANRAAGDEWNPRAAAAKAAVAAGRVDADADVEAMDRRADVDGRNMLAVDRLMIVGSSSV
jgi:hypothetical protein